MEHLSGVQARIAVIRGMVDGARPGGPRFAELLNQALASKAASETATGARRADTLEAAAIGRTATLSRTPAPAAPAAPTQPHAGAPPAPGQLVTPVVGPLTSSFGPRIHPITRRAQHHSGVDFGAPSGTPIQSAAAGTVTFAGERGSYGNLVIVDHGGGVETRYAHQRDIAVRAGQRVEAGQLLGTVGSTGRSTGPHLHFEVRRDGQAVNPLPWLPRVP
jgi:murein DD-endopeptidase MepM/ murein hydrolase activator NlpD